MTSQEEGNSVNGQTENGLNIAPGETLPVHFNFNSLPKTQLCDFLSIS